MLPILDLFSPPVRSVDSSLTPSVSICDMGAAGTTRPERTGLVRLKSEIKQVRAGGTGLSQQVLWVKTSYKPGRTDGKVRDTDASRS